MENSDKKKVYGMLLEIRETFFLSIQYATSLEEAFNQAKLEFHKLNPQKGGVNISTMGAKIGLFSIKNVNHLVNENRTYDDKHLEKIVMKHRKAEQEELKKEIKKPVEIKKIELSETDVKNMIMKEIITKKDKNMFEQHKNLFNDYETQYLKEAMQKKSK